MPVALFVCTGNICRSPTAEAMARAVGPADSEWVFRSAGLRALAGHPATRGAIDAAGEHGLDLTGHRATQLTASMAAAADRIYVMTRRQAAALRWMAPEAAERVELLDPAGRDIEDPYGMRLNDYRLVRDHIAAAVEERRTDWESI